MANLTNVNRCTQSTFNKIVAGTHATETYDDNAIYEVELDEPISLGAEGSGLSINNNNELVLSSPLPSVTSSDNGKVMMVVNGAWTASPLPTYNGEVE